MSYRNIEFRGLLQAYNIEKSLWAAPSGNAFAIIELTALLVPERAFEAWPNHKSSSSKRTAVACRASSLLLK
jgi:hypothetical protein